MIVGARYYDNGQTNEGMVFVYYGNGGAGQSLRPRQRRADDQGPIAPLGLTDNPSIFLLYMTGRTPFGRGKIRARSEVKPLGIPFDGTGFQEQPSWSDTGGGGAGIFLHNPVYDTHLGSGLPLADEASLRPCIGSLAVRQPMVDGMVEWASGDGSPDPARG